MVQSSKLHYFCEIAKQMRPKLFAAGGLLYNFYSFSGSKNDKEGITVVIIRRYTLSGKSCMVDYFM